MFNFNFLSIWNEIMIFCTSSESTLLFCLIILLFWLGILLFLGIKIRTHKKAILKYCKLLFQIKSEDQLEKQFEKINTSFKENPYLREPWEGFSKTFIRYQTAQGEKIMAMALPDSFLNPQIYLERHIDQAFYNAVPNYLTGTGIFFTFVGLAAGIYQAKNGFASGNLDQITDSLRQLLGGASLAFWTSIVGLACSISFSWYSKYNFRSLYYLLTKLCGEMERLFPLITQETITYEQLKELKTQSQQLKLFNTDLAISIAEALDSRISSQLIGLVESIKQMLSSLIEETLMPKLKHMTSILESIRSDRYEALESLIQNTTKTFRETLSAATKEEFMSLAKEIEDLTVLIASSKDTMESAQRQFLEAIKRMESEAGERLREVCDIIRTSSKETAIELKIAGEDIKNNIAQSVEEIKSMISSVASDLIVAGEKVKTNFEAVHSHVDVISEKLKNVVDLFHSNVEGLKITLQECDSIIRSSRDIIENNIHATKQLNDVINSISTAITTLSEINEKLSQTSETVRETTELSKLTKEEINKLIGVLHQERQNIVRAWTIYEERFRNLDEKLQKIFTEINIGLEVYIENLKKYVKDLEEHMAKAVEILGGGISELSESIEELIGLLIKVKEK